MSPLTLFFWIEYHIYKARGIDHKWFNLKRGKMYLPLSPTFKDNRRRFGLREPYTEKILKRCLKPGMTVFEIGPCMGEFTLRIADYIEDSGHCYTFEPFPKYVDIMEKLIEGNDLKNVTLVPRAVGNGPGEVAFSSEDKGSVDAVNTMWNFKPKKKIDVKEKTGKITKVPILKISDFIKEKDLSVDFLFMDIEGCETLVFDDLFENLSLDKFPVIYFEGHQGIYGQEKLDEIIADFKSKGFHSEQITNQHYLLTPERLSRRDAA